MPDSDERSALLAANSKSGAGDETVGDGHGLSESSSSATLCGESARLTKEKEKPFPWRIAISLYILTCITPLAFDLIFPFVSK